METLIKEAAQKLSTSIDNFYTEYNEFYEAETIRVMQDGESFLVAVVRNGIADWKI